MKNLCSWQAVDNEVFAIHVALAGTNYHRRLAGKVSQCGGCKVEFCRLYGQLGKNLMLCPDCKDFRAQETRASHRTKRKASIRAARVETVSPLSVFKRDEWRCRICGVSTPKHLRGTYEHNAPELDHEVPLSRAGAHSYGNTQLLCRSCNGLKSNRTTPELMAWLDGG